MGATGMGLAIAGKTALGILGDQAGADAQAKELGMYAKRADDNARVKLLQAEEAKYQGREAMVAHGRAVSSLLGKQRASTAAQGIVVDEGSARDIQDETSELASEDLARIRVNAARQAMGFELESSALKREAESYRRQAKRAKSGTLLSGIGRVASGGLDLYSYLKG